MTGRPEETYQQITNEAAPLSQKRVRAAIQRCLCVRDEQFIVLTKHSFQEVRWCSFGHFVVFDLHSLPTMVEKHCTNIRVYSGFVSIRQNREGKEALTPTFGAHTPATYTNKIARM